VFDFYLTAPCADAWPRAQPRRTRVYACAIMATLARIAPSSDRAKIQMADHEKKIDTFDVDALEKSVNESASRVSKIWTSYLIFGLYLVISTGTVTHRQLLLEESIKLPVLNIELSLIGFFVIAPLLFAALHIYVLIQILLLARTADAYEQALLLRIPTLSDRERFRQRLANTLFAQLFAGALTERHGLVGNVLRLMSWVTLVIAPTLVLLTAQVKFLPYHGAQVTWLHRALIGLDLAATLTIWSATANLSEKIGWRLIARNKVACVFAILVLYFALIPASFPGEAHTGVVSRAARAALRLLPEVAGIDTSIPAECTPRRLLYDFFAADFDRLTLENLHIADDQIVSNIDKDSRLREQDPYEGQRTRSFRDRDLRCATLRGIDLRRSDFTSANLAGADLTQSDLQGTQFRGANLAGATLDRARLQSAGLQGAVLVGANLRKAQLQAVMAIAADLRGAILSGAHLQAANLRSARLDAADLRGAYMQIADLTGASLRAARLREAMLQGADFDRSSDLGVAEMLNIALWRTAAGDCAEAEIVNPAFDMTARVDATTRQQHEKDTRGILEMTYQSLSSVPEAAGARVRDRLQARLGAEQGQVDDRGETTWRACIEQAVTRNVAYADRLTSYLITLVCSPTPEPQNAVSSRHMVEGILRNWIEFATPDSATSKAFASSLVRRFDTESCPATAFLDMQTKLRLRSIRDGSPVNATTARPSPLFFLLPW
jgi:uncharacterized protein YjbI with pentapeptide repeats